MKDRYINSQLDKIKNQIDELNKEKELANSLTNGSILILSIFTIGAVFSFPAFSIASTIGLGASIIANRKYKRIYEDKIERLENEQEHLKKVGNDVPKATTDLNRKRVQKLKALRKNKNDLEASYETTKSINGLAAVVEITGAALSLVNPIFSIIGFGGLAVNLINGHNMTKKNREIQNTTNRIRNIENDLEVIKNDERDKQGQRIGTRKVMKPTNTNTNTNTNQNTNTQQTQVYKPLPNRTTSTTQQVQQPVQNNKDDGKQNKYKKAVDRYLGRLVKFGDNYINNQKVKK